MRSIAGVLGIVLLGAFSSPAGAAPAPSEQAQAAFALAFGRVLSADDMSAFSESFASQAKTMDEFSSVYQMALGRNAAEKRRVAEKAYADAFGLLPGQGDLDNTATGTYAEMVTKHVKWLTEHPSDYEALLDRAYLQVARRGIYPEEISYWKPHGVLPYFLVVACLEDWARRNQPGLMVTAGTPTVSVNSGYLSTIRLTPGVVHQVRTSIQLPVSTASDASYASNRTVIAPAAENLISSGGIHFVAVGAPDLPVSSSAK